MTPSAASSSPSPEAGLSVVLAGGGTAGHISPMLAIADAVIDHEVHLLTEPGALGEVVVRGHNLLKGYLGRPEDTAQVVTADGWFRTGDLGRLDADGFVFVEDRLKDMIVSGGENIYSPEIERVLAEHPAVMEVAVIGVPDPRWGETVKAVVALREGQQADEAELVDHCRRHLARYKCPTSVDVLPLLPRNPTGKILKRDLRKPYWDGRDRQTV